MTPVTEKRIGFADSYGTVGTVDVEDDGDIRAAIGVGMCEGIGYPTSDAARQYAAALLDAADESDRIKAAAA